VLRWWPSFSRSVPFQERISTRWFSAADAVFRGLKLHELAAYIVAQVAGACAGVVVANLMFSLACGDHFGVNVRAVVVCGSARWSPRFALLL